MDLSCRALLQLLADETRLRSVVLLRDSSELCVCELVHALETAQPKVSRHLALLREAGVVDDRRDGQWVYYRLHPALPRWAVRLIEDAALAASGEPAFRADAQRLEEMPCRPDERRCA
jgi:ArsR family transcriptional regulator